MEFVERYPIETGFTPIFESEVRPKLMALEDDRVVALGKAKKYVALSIVITVALCAAVIAIWGPNEFPLFMVFFFAILGVIGVVASWSIQASGWTSAVADAVMPAICEHVGDITFDRDGGNNTVVRVMNQMGLLPNHDTSSQSNYLAGKHRGTSYQMMQLSLSRRSRDSDGKEKKRTVYNGLVFQIDVPVEAPGEILILHDYGGFGNKITEMFSFGGARSGEKVHFDNAAFEAAFEVFADQPTEVEKFMPPQFLENLLTIGEEEGGGKGAKAMVAGFKDASFYLALSRRGSFMQMGKLTTPVADMEENLHDIFHDIELSHRIIDRLHGA